MRQNKKNKGFTLVELLIVVAIIGILAAVLTPQFLNARKVAADRAGEAYVSNVYTAVQAHYIEDGTTNLTIGATGMPCNDGFAPTDGKYPVATPASGLKFADANACNVRISEQGDVAIKYTVQNGSNVATYFPNEAAYNAITD